MFRIKLFASKIYVHILFLHDIKMGYAQHKYVLRYEQISLQKKLNNAMKELKHPNISEITVKKIVTGYAANSTYNLPRPHYD